MFKTIKKFWDCFWESFSGAFKTAYNSVFKRQQDGNIQYYRDTKRINLMAIVISKLNSLVNAEATISIDSDSSQAERLEELCEDLQNNRFDITAEMLGNGDYWVFPSLTDGEIYHRYVSAQNVSILAMDGTKITDILGIIDSYITDDGTTYLLNRRHTLDGKKLIIDIYTTNDSNERVRFEKWEEMESTYAIQNANYICVGRFKSPTSSRGISTVYGVPLNFGCEEIERKCFSDLKMIETEFSRAESKIFADPLIMRKTKDNYDIPEGMFPINSRSGTNGSSIDIFSPTIRYSAYRDKLMDDLAQYEQQIGTDKGFLTQLESVSATTATEIRRANASTIALIDRIRNSIKCGIDSTLKSDAIFLSISEDLYTVNIDWFDAFTDEATQFQRIASAVDRGTAEKQDEMKWLFPNLTAEELDEKLARIDEYKLQNSKSFFTPTNEQGDEQSSEENEEESDNDELKAEKEK